MPHTLHDKYAQHKSQETEHKKHSNNKKTELKKLISLEIKARVEIKKILCWHCIRSHTVLSAKSPFYPKESEQTI